MSRIADGLHFLPQASGFNADMSDGLSGTQYTDVVNMAKYRSVLFVIQKGAGAVGTATITVESVSTAGAGATQAIAYRYKTGTTLDALSDWTAVASTGFTTTAGADQVYLIEVDGSDSYSTYNYVRMKTVEVAATAVDCTILIIMGQARQMLENPITAIT
jgi:hypothetical protein